MATEKVGVYRKWYGPVPIDKFGAPQPKSDWPRLRPFSWAVRWFGTNGKRFSKSFKNRKTSYRQSSVKKKNLVCLLFDK